LAETLLAIISITGNGIQDVTYVEIDGEQYFGDEEIEVPLGTEVRCAYFGGYLYLNGELSDMNSEHTFEATGNVGITFVDSGASIEVEMDNSEGDPELTGEHTAMVGATVYPITEGICLADGTGYKIDMGRTMVNGTIYDVSWKRTIRITGAGRAKSYDENYDNYYGCFVELEDGTSYPVANGQVRIPVDVTIDVNQGDVLILQTTNSVNLKSYIYLNGEEPDGIEVSTSGGRTDKRFEYRVTKNATITLEYNLNTLPNRIYIED